MESLSPEAHRLGAVLVIVIIFWVTEALPLAVTALLGPVVAVMLGVAPAVQVFAPMANPIIFLFIGSFILAQALFVHRVNERIAHSVLSWKVIDGRPTRILVAYGGLAAFLSAWMSNTATAAMLVPIAISLIAFMEKEGNTPPSYGTALMLMTAYACSLGGMATPVGTPPNLIALGMLRERLDVQITFVDWMLIATPVVVVGLQQIVADRKAALGPWKPGERNAVIACAITVCLWVGPGLLSILLGRDHAVSQMVLETMPESVAALLGVVVLFLLPINNEQRSTITWKEASRIDWGTILLFGGGLALGSLSASTGLARVMGEGITGLLSTDSVVPLTFAACLFTVVLSEAMSNTAATNIAVPIVISVAQAAGVDPIVPAIAAALSASVAIVLPVSTPPNAIVYSSGRVPITTMIRYGLLLDAVAVLVVPMLVLSLM
jgi:sodium-dependent dicarboxylate transporter 2/3/5